MNKIDSNERVARLQQAAEQAERQGSPPGDADVDAYRLVIRAVRQAPMPAMAEDFAARIASRLGPGAEPAGIEDGVVILLLLGMALGGGGYFMPKLWPMLSSLPISLPHLSWQWIIAAALAISLAWAIDKFWERHPGGIPA